MFGALAPILIPAAIGAFTSAAMGRNPLQGAVMGGITGGLLGPAGGNLFNLGSPTVAATAGTGAATSGATAFGANQAPLAGLFSTTPEQVATTAMNSAYTGPVSGTVGNIHTGYGMSPESIVASNNMPISQYASGIHTQDPTQLARASKEVSGQTFIDASSDANFNIADQIMPRFGEPIRVTEQASKTGGYEKPLYERAYESVINYAQQNPLQVAGLGLVASGGIRPRQPQISGTSVGSITKGTPPQNVGQPLQVRRPTRFA